MSRDPLVSVIMNCYNSDTYLKEAIDSVISQTYENWEIIFWDNQSTDKSAEIVKSYDDKRIKYFYAPTHTTLGEGRNKALEKAHGEFISFLDCDDLWKIDKIELTLPFFSDEKVGLVHTNGYYFYDEKKTYMKFHRFIQPSGYILEKLISNYSIKLVSAMFRADAYKQDKIVFNNEFSMIEEFDFFIRMSVNWKVVYSNNYTCLWRAHSSSLTWSNMDNVGREYELFLKKLLKDFPFLSDKKCIKKIKAKIAYHEYKGILEKQNIAKRSLLKPFLFVETKLFIPYSFSFLDKKLYGYFLKLFKKSI